MNNQELSSKAFISGWNGCRKWICKEFNLDEKKVIELEKSENEKN